MISGIILAAVHSHSILAALCPELPKIDRSHVLPIAIDDPDKAPGGIGLPDPIGDEFFQNPECFVASFDFAWENGPFTVCHDATVIVNVKVEYRHGGR